jgi:hypothetical protein
MKLRMNNKKKNVSDNSIAKTPLFIGYRRVDINVEGELMLIKRILGINPKK